MSAGISFPITNILLESDVKCGYFIVPPVQLIDRGNISLKTLDIISWGILHIDYWLHATTTMLSLHVQNVIAAESAEYEMRGIGF